MPTPFLGANVIGTLQPLRYLGATSSNLGTAAPGSGAGSYSTGARSPMNPIIRHKGFLYAGHPGGIYRSRDDGQTWETIYTPGYTPLATDTRYYAGIYKVYVDGEPWLIVPSGSTSGLQGMTLDKDDNGSDLSNAGLQGPFDAGFCVGGNEIYFTNAFSQPVARNPSTGAFVNYATSGTPYAFCWWQGKMHLATNSGGNTFLYTLQGGVATIEGSFGTNLVFGRMFVDPSTNELIHLALNGGNNQWQCFKVSTSYTFTQLTGAGTPLDGTPWPTSSTGRLHAVYADQEDAGVETDPSIYLIWTANISAGTPFQQWKWNGQSSVITLQDTGGDIQNSIVHDTASASQRFYTARPPGVDLTPNAEFYGNGNLIVDGTEKQIICDYPRSQIVASNVPAATYDLSTQALTNTPIKPGSVTIRGVIGATVEIAQDDGAGAFPMSTLLPLGGTIDYATGTMAGTTASLDASTDVEALYSGGTCTLYVYRTIADDAYQTNDNTNQAGILNTSHGSIDNTGDGPKINNVPCDGTIITIGIDMSGFSAGTRASFQLWTI